MRADVIRVTLTTRGKRHSREFPAQPASDETWWELLDFVLETLQIPPHVLSQEEVELPTAAARDWAGQTDGTG